jgi:adenine nucleotide transporter 17
VYYYWYEFTRAFFEKAALKAGRASRKLTTVESMIAGALAGTATVLMTNPIWVINTRMTTHKKDLNEQVLPGAKPSKAPSTLGTLLALIRDEGPTRLFSGVMPALVLVINPILQYTVFEQLKNMLEKKRRVTPTDAFYLGALGKLLATSITYPYITVKSRMHVAGRDGPRENMLTTFRRIIREEGYSGLYGGRIWTTLRKKNIRTDIDAGIGPKVTQSVITAAFLFAFKDALYAWTVSARRKVALKKA